MSDEKVPEGTVPEVVEEVGDDPELAKATLEAEKESDSPRSTLVEKLEKVAEEGDDTEDEAAEEDKSEEEEAEDESEDDEEAKKDE